MFVHGYNTQSDMARFLCRRERDLSFKQFRSSLLKTEALDPENFSVTDITLAEQHYLFVSSEHAFKRMRIRGAFNRYETLERCVELLQNPLIIPYISNYHVSMDDDDRIVENETGYRTIPLSMTNREWYSSSKQVTSSYGWYPFGICEMACLWLSHLQKSSSSCRG